MKNEATATLGISPPQKRDDVSGLSLDGSDEEMPMDERQDYQKQLADALSCNVTKEGIDDNLCDYTLQAMGEMCGLGPNGEKGQGKSHHRIPSYAFRTGVEEHTSIEVEYVEPRLRSGNLSNSKKNMVLNSISKKAKDDYEKNKTMSSQDKADKELKHHENVYSTFTPPEKRKFLKLINSGMAPKEATRQVLRERREGEEAAREEAETPSKSKETGILQRSEMEGMEGPKDGESFAKSGINYYDAVRKENLDDEYDEDEAQTFTASGRKKKFGIFSKKNFNKLRPEPREKPAPRPKSKKASQSRSLVEETPVEEEKKQETSMEEEMTAQLLAPMASTPERPRSVEISKEAKELDELEMYLSSTNVGSGYGGASVADHLTVVTNKSYKTTGTTGTNYTTSTRSRRPGQAQMRMQQQKAGENIGRRARPTSNQTRGWQESIQQAAIDNNRQWDPKLGWVDFADANAPPGDRYRSEDMIEVPSQTSDRDTVNLMGSKDLRKTGGASSSPGRQGWVESMKAATAKLGVDGKRWDPVLGWVGLGDVDYSSPRHDDGKINTQSASDTADFGTASGNKSRRIAPELLDTEGQDEKLMIYEDDHSHDSGNEGEYMQIGQSGSVKKHEAVGAKSIPKLQGSKRDTTPRSPSKQSTPSSSQKRGKMHQYWEDRSSTGADDAPKPEWKAYLAKKVQAAQAESDAESDVFSESEGSFPSRRPGNTQGRGGRQYPLNSKTDLDRNGQPYYPNRNYEYEDDDDITRSEVVSEASTAAFQPNTFMGRLQACAAPMATKVQNSAAACAPGVPMGAHLAFLKNNPSLNGSSPQNKNGAGKFVPPHLCGRPDVINEDDDISRVTDVPRSRSNPRAFSNPKSNKSDVSSVISDEMSGSKSAFLESMAMKAAVRSSSRSKRRPTSSGSEASGASSQPKVSSEKWQQFLDKKKSGDAESVTTPRSQASSVSRAAEKYAAKKVQEMQRSQSQSRTFPALSPSPSKGSMAGASVVSPQNLPFEPPKSSAQLAAEEVKAARMKELRESLSPQTKSNMEGKEI